MLKKTGCPEVIRHSETIFSKLVDPQIRDTLTTDIRILSVLLNGEENGEIADASGLVGRVLQTLPADLRSAFTLAGMDDTTSRGHLLPNFLINGLFYSISSKHAGNSCVMFSPAVGQQLVPARIIYIVQIMDSGTLSTYLAVRRHKPLDGSHSDPYLHFPVLRAQLWDSQLNDGLEILIPTQISSHFACLPIKVGQRKLIVALSLSRSI